VHPLWTDKNILFNTIPPCPSQTGEGDGREGIGVKRKHVGSEFVWLDALPAANQC